MKFSCSSVVMSGEPLSQTLSHATGAIDAVFHSKLFWRTCRFVISLLCFAGCLYQITVLLALYFLYPENVAVTVEGNGQLDFPGITLCSTVGVRKTRLEMMEGFNEGINQVNGSEGSTNKSAIQSKIDQFYRQYLDLNTMAQLVSNGLNYSEFVDVNFTKCALDEQFSESFCKRLDHLETFQGNQMCYTLFHLSDTSKVTKLIPRSGIATSAVVVGSTVINIEDSERPMHPNEVIRFLVNFQLHEATNLNEPSSGKVLIHDPKDIPAVRMSSTYIKAGRYYEIYVSEQVSQLLPAPFASNCTNYSDINLQAYVNVSKQNFPNPLFEKPLSQSSCYFSCLGKRAKDSCGCWPPEIPYLITPSLRNQSTAKLCNWLKLSQTSFSHKSKDENETAQEADNSNALKKFNQCVVKNEKFCSDQCSKDCNQRRFFTTVQSYQWPSDERINFSSNAMTLKQFRKCCAIVSIRYYTDEATLYISSPKYEIIEFFSYVGGIVSLWLGFTFIGIYDYIKDSHEWVKEKITKGNGLRSTVVKSAVRMKRMATASHRKRVALQSKGTAVRPMESPKYSSGRRTKEERYPWIYASSSYIKPSEMLDWKGYYQKQKNRLGGLEEPIPIQRKFVGNPSYISSYRFQ